MQQRAFSSESTSQTSQQPLVSICTVTYDRPEALKLLEKRILEQTYPRERMEWVVIDDSPSNIPNFEPNTSSGLKVVYQRLPEKLPLGKKRNTSNDFCRGDIIVYMDDDDYYPPTRVEHAVQKLISSDCLVAGSTILPILFVPENELWVSGPFSKNHATANTFAFKRELLNITRFEDDATCAEEKKFLQDYSIQMVQLEPKHTIVCIGHNRNTYEKRQLIQGGKNPRFKQITDLNQSQILLLEQVAQAHAQIMLKQSKPSPLLHQSKATVAQIAQPKAPVVPPIDIILPLHNCKDSIKACIDSIRRQQKCHFNVIAIDDASDDQSFEITHEAIDGDPRFRLYRSLTRGGKITNFVRCIENIIAKDDSIIIHLDPKGQLNGSDALSLLAQVYKETNCWLTYGGSITKQGYRASEAYDFRTIRDNRFRSAPWRAGSLQTFRRSLWGHLSDDDLRNGSKEYFAHSLKEAIMLPFLELAGFRQTHIADAIYIEDSTEDDLANDWQREYDQEVQEIRSKQPYTALAELATTTGSQLNE